MLIAPALLADILAHAADDPAVEACGLLFGTEERIVAVERTRNVAAAPARWFEVDPAALFRALRAERAGGPRLIGHYHSHPSGSVTPSPRDRAAAEPGRFWLIVAGAQAGLWLARAGGFVSVALQSD